MKKGIRTKIWKTTKPHLPYFLTILTGVLLLISVWRMKGPTSIFLGILAMPMIVGALYAWSEFLGKAHEEKDPYFFDDPIYEKRWEKVLHYGSGIFMILSFLIGVATQFLSENLISENKVFVASLVVGALVASVVLFFWKKAMPKIFVSNETRWQELMCIWVGIVCMTIAAIVGFIFCPEPISSREEKVQIIEHGANKKEPVAYIWINYRGEKMKLRPTSSDYRKLEGKDSAIITISKSFLGVEYICDMKPD